MSCGSGVRNIKNRHSDLRLFLYHQELQAALPKIGIDGKRYSEVFFTSFDSDVLGLYGSSLRM